MRIVSLNKEAHNVAMLKPINKAPNVLSNASGLGGSPGTGTGPVPSLGTGAPGIGVTPEGNIDMMNAQRYKSKYEGKPTEIAQVALRLLFPMTSTY
jgi:hypothetical protein